MSVHFALCLRNRHLRFHELVPLGQHQIIAISIYVLADLLIALVPVKAVTTFFRREIFVAE